MPEFPEHPQSTLISETQPVIAGSTLALPDRGLDGVPTTDAGVETWSVHLQRLKRAGFSAIDLVDTWISPAVLSERALLGLRDELDARQLKMVGLTVIRKSIIDPVYGLRNLEHTYASIEAAHILGAPLICIGFHRPLTEDQQKYPFWLVNVPTDDRSESSYQVAADRLRDVCRYAARYGIDVSLELYEGTLLNTGRSAVKLLKLVGEPNLGLNPDLANLYREPHTLAESWLDTLGLCAPHMNYWHLKNFARVSVWPSGPIVSFPTALAEGDIDYRLAIDVVLRAGYPGPFCIEHYGGDRVVAQQQGLLYINSVLQDLAAEQ